MLPFLSFINHFNLPKILKGERNASNRNFRSGIYIIVSIIWWLLLIPLKILDVLGFYYLLDWIRGLFLKHRTLSDYEVLELSLVFGNKMNYNSIKINEQSYFARVGAKNVGKPNLGFVLFNTINFSRPIDCENSEIDMRWLVHEVVHVAQFRKLGIQYIIEALRAQKNGGYNYGGIRDIQSNVRLSSYNLEQQADIARDYYKYLKLDSNYKNIYSPYIRQLQEGKF